MHEETTELINYLRKAQREFFEKNGLEGAYWRVDFIIREMDSNFTQELRKITDEEK